MSELTGPQLLALRVIDDGDCWQERGRAITGMRIDMLNRLMRAGLVSWSNRELPANVTGQASLTDRGREALREASDE